MVRTITATCIALGSRADEPQGFIAGHARHVEIHQNQGGPWRDRRRRECISLIEIVHDLFAVGHKMKYRRSSQARRRPPPISCGRICCPRRQGSDADVPAGTRRSRRSQRRSVQWRQRPAWQCDSENRAYSRLTSGGNRAAVAVDDLAADREPDAAALDIRPSCADAEMARRCARAWRSSKPMPLSAMVISKTWQTVRVPASNELGDGADRYKRRSIRVAILDGV